MKLKVPKCKQGKDDYACGPTCISMVMDCYLKKKRRRLSKGDRESILEETMGGDKYRDAGPRRKVASAETSGVAKAIYLGIAEEAARYGVQP